MKKNIGTRFALAGLGTALSVLFVTLAYFVKSVSLSFTILASIGVMLPLIKNYYREGLLTCVAASIIGFLIVNINILSFVLASSFYIVFTVFWNDKKLNKTIGYCIKAAYSILVFFLLYKAVSLITIDFSLLPKLGNLHPAVLYLLLNVVFSIAFIVYDLLIIQAFLYLKKLLSKVAK
jgi:hypothetical protein